MESPQAPLRQLKINYTIMTTVLDVMDGYVHFEGLNIAIYFGDNVQFKEGDKVKVTFERINVDAIPSQPPK